MTKRDVVALASKILGLYMVVGVISYIPAIVAMVSVFSTEGPGFGTWLEIGVSFMLYGLIARFLIVRSDTIGSWLYPDEETQAVVVALDKDVLLQVAFIGIGVFLLARALTGFPGAILSIYWHARYAELGGARDAWTALLRVVLEGGLGFYLAFGTRGLMRAIQYLRRA